jgi:DNA-binding MarR family transcriptional regulator
LEVEPITLCRLMDRMEKSGLVERRPDPEDRRAHRLFITEQSRQSSAELSSIGATLMAEVTDGLSPEELETLQSLLLRLRSNLAKVGTSS